jgi:hypothetical protein
MKTIISEDLSPARDQVRTLISEQLWGRIWDQVQIQVRWQVWDQVWDHVRTQVQDQVWSQISNENNNQ